MSRSARIVVALVGINTPGYRSLANAYLSASLRAEARLPQLWLTTPEFTTATDPWWIAYQLLDIDPAPDLVGFSVVCWNARSVYETVRVLKSARPEIRVVLGGPEVGPIAEQVLAENPEVDFVVRGEGERTLPELVLSMSRGGDPCSVPGISARSGNFVVSAPDRPEIASLDEIASPFAGRAHATDGSAYLETYRGCPHRCAYCYEGKGSPTIRSYSWERIAEDVSAVASTPGMTSFSFIDPVFNLTRDRLGRLASILEPWARRGIRLHTIEVDIERVDDEQAALLARCGVVSVETGPQTVGGQALTTCGRSFDRERFEAGVEACRRFGISVECDLIVGLPGDTFEDVLAGMEFALGLDPGRVQMSTLHVLPGTDLWERADELGLRYDRFPPHELVSTRDLDYRSLRRLEVLGNAATAIYRARLPRKEQP